MVGALKGTKRGKSKEEKDKEEQEANKVDEELAKSCQPAFLFVGILNRIGTLVLGGAVG